MVRFNTKGGQAFLDDDADDAATAPQPDNESGPKAALEYLPTKTESIQQVITIGKEEFRHRRIITMSGQIAYA